MNVIGKQFNAVNHLFCTSQKATDSYKRHLKKTVNGARFLKKKTPDRP